MVRPQTHRACVYNIRKALEFFPGPSLGNIPDSCDCSQALLIPGWGQAHVTVPAIMGPGVRPFSEDRAAESASLAVPPRSSDRVSPLQAPGLGQASSTSQEGPLAVLTGAFSAARQQTNYRPVCHERRVG